MEMVTDSAIPPVKSESRLSAKTGGDSRIKPEADSSVALPGGSAWEEDVYEDAGDLDFRELGNGVYLTRIPRFLWKTWSQLDDDQEIQLGRVRVEGPLSDVKRVGQYQSDTVVSTNLVSSDEPAAITRRAHQWNCTKGVQYANH